jgi:hypothetical protein
MTKMLTEYEAWMEIAAHMRHGRVIPNGPGLCMCIDELEDQRLIDCWAAESMKCRLFRRYGHIAPGWIDPLSLGVFLWTPDLIAPRIRACDALAAECLREMK